MSNTTEYRTGFPTIVYRGQRIKVRLIPGAGLTRYYWGHAVDDDLDHLKGWIDTVA